MSRKVNTTAILKILDHNKIANAIQKVTDVLESTTAKHSEVLNAADKLIKYHFMFQDAARKQVLDAIEIEHKQLALEEKQIKMELLRGATGPNATPQKQEAYSRTFNPPTSKSMDDPDGIKEA